MTRPSNPPRNPDLEAQILAAIDASPDGLQVEGIMAAVGMSFAHVQLACHALVNNGRLTTAPGLGRVYIRRVLPP